MTERESWQAELKHLRGRLKAITGQLLSSSTAASTGMGGGIEPRDVHSLNAQIRAGQGVDRIRRRIAELEALLED